MRPEHMWYLPPDTLVVRDYLMGPVTRFDTAGRVLDRRHSDLGGALEQLPDQASPESRTIALPDGSLVKVVLRDRDLERPPDDALVRHPPVEFVRLDNTYATVSLWLPRAGTRHPYTSALETGTRSGSSRSTEIWSGSSAARHLQCT